MGPYEGDANHVWNIDADCLSVDVDVTKMNTEEDYDYLTINEKKFSGHDPFKVKCEDILFWGWKRLIFNMYFLILSWPICQVHSKSPSGPMQD